MVPLPLDGRSLFHAATLNSRLFFVFVAVVGWRLLLAWRLELLVEQRFSLLQLGGESDDRLFRFGLLAPHIGLLELVVLAEYQAHQVLWVWCECVGPRRGFVIGEFLEFDILNKLTVLDGKVRREEEDDQVHRALTACREIRQLYLDVGVEPLDVVVQGLHLLGEVMQILADVVGRGVCCGRKLGQQDLEVGGARRDILRRDVEACVIRDHVALRFLADFSRKTYIMRESCAWRSWLSR